MNDEFFRFGLEGDGADDEDKTSEELDLGEPFSLDELIPLEELAEGPSAETPPPAETADGVTPDGTAEAPLFEEDAAEAEASDAAYSALLSDEDLGKPEEPVSEEADEVPAEDFPMEEAPEVDLPIEETPETFYAAPAAEATDEEPAEIPAAETVAEEPAAASDEEPAEVPAAEEPEVPAAAATSDEEIEPSAEGPSEGGSEEGQAISSDLIRGHINTIILRSLYDGDKYGYEIIAEIERKSHNQYTLKQPSLYSALKRLEKDGYITSYWGGSVAGGRRKYFSLTDAGKEISERNQTEWEYSRTVIDSLISDKEFNFAQPAPTAVDMRMLRKSTSRVPDRESADDGEFDYEEFGGAQPEALPEQPSVSEEERQRIEESYRAREEVLRAREEASTKREQELLEREFSLQAETERRNTEYEVEQARRSAAFEEEEERLRSERQAQFAEEQERLREEQQREFEAERQRLREEFEAEQNRLREELDAEKARRAELEAEKTLLHEEEEARAVAREELGSLAPAPEAPTEETEIPEETPAEEAPDREEIESASAAALSQDKTAQNARIASMEPFAEERAKYEQLLREQRAAYEAAQRRALAEQEARIREEDERFYREREEQMIHQNYLNLVAGKEEAPKQPESYYYDSEPAEIPYVSKPENEREYRSIIRKLYMGTVREEPAPSPRPQPAPKPAYPRSAFEPSAQAEETPRGAKVSRVRSLDGIDFYDLENRAAQDGIRINVAGGRKKEVKEQSESLVHKGKALFLSALVVFLLCVAEGSIALGFQRRLSLPILYPWIIWGSGLALLLVTGLLYLNRYGERALRQTGNVLVNAIVAYALCVIIILIVALGVKIDFTDGGKLATYIVFPAVYFFGIVVFGIAYHLQIRPAKRD